MTKDELVAIAVERKLVRTKTEARSMKIDELRALVEAARDLIEPNSEVSERLVHLELEAEVLRPQNLGREVVDERVILTGDAIEVDPNVPTEAANQIVRPSTETARKERERQANLSAIERILALPQRNRHERRRRDSLLRQAQRA